jgi:hypothetical protein
MMNLSASEICLISGGFTITGVLIGALITYKIAFSLAFINAKREASAKLRAAFAHEIASMRLAGANQKTIEVEALLFEAFPRHAAAIEEYRPFVRVKDLAAYQQAWENYYCIGGSVRFFDYYMGDGCYDLFQSRIDEILKFTKPNSPFQLSSCIAR